VRRRKALIGAALVCAIALSVTPASANHANYHCDGDAGGYSDNAKRYLQFHWINWSAWSLHSLDHIAIREDTAQNETYHELWPGEPAYHEVVTYDGLDHALRTVVQRAGYAFDYWGMDEWSHNFC
jgi:hypothetical protein